MLGISITTTTKARSLAQGHRTITRICLIRRCASTSVDENNVCSSLDCRGGPLWPPQSFATSSFRSIGAPTEGRPYNRANRAQYHLGTRNCVYFGRHFGRGTATPASHADRLRQLFSFNSRY